MTIPLQFGNGWPISSAFYNRCNYLSMLGSKLIHVSKMGPGILQPQHMEGVMFKALFIHSTCILVCFSEHWYIYTQGYSVFYTTADAGGSQCFSVLDGLKRLYWWQRMYCDDLVSFCSKTDISGLCCFTAAYEKRYSTLYKLVIGVIIIIIKKWCAMLSSIYCLHYIFFYEN